MLVINRETTVVFYLSQDLRETQESQVPVDFLEIGETLDLLVNTSQYSSLYSSKIILAMLKLTCMCSCRTRTVTCT